MEFIETTIFTRQVLELLSEREYCNLQISLMMNPQKGVVISGGGGLRKIRWPMPGRGKSGGARVIYYYKSEEKIILLLLMYLKNE
ncbi:MAG: type II toxin-antitoxin system RelE/ParE family toxin, partial [Anaerolineaceae bacterium]|nr:type II toxin-antitoxin system RelE/ParE family toxin [Anaerolineaceae bacterium]